MNLSKNIVKQEPNSAKELDKVARRLLRAAEVGDQLPTPQDDIIATAKLIKGGEIDLEDFKESFLRKARRVFFNGWRKIRGALAVGDKTIYISSDVPESQKPFLNFHEVSHHVIPWQKDTFDLFADDSLTLTPEVEIEFEQEANYLSAQLLFQGDRFANEARDFDLSLKTGIKFKHDYQTSFHSTFWNYIATHNRSCVLFVFRQCRYTEFYKGSMEQAYQLLYTVPSKSFFAEFGEMNLPDKFYHDDPIFNAIDEPVDKLSDVFEGELELRDMNGSPVDTKFEAWSNTYNLFVLISKKKRVMFSKKRVAYGA